MARSELRVVIMKAVRLAPVAALLFFSLTVASVFGGGYIVGTPILGVVGVPVLAAPSICGNAAVVCGTISLLYADGSPVYLSTLHVTFSLCSSSCVSVPATLKQIEPGRYKYTFTPPSLSGTVTIYIRAGTLADDNGRIFPSVDTSIGTYTPPASASTAGTSSPSTPASPTQPLMGTAPSSEIQQAVTPTETTQTGQSPITTVIATLSALALVGLLLTLLPRRH